MKIGSDRVVTGNLTRREFIKAIGGSAALLSLPDYTNAEHSSQPKISTACPNIVFIIVDDLGWVDLGCYGGNKHHIPTPNIDRLAAEGVRFTQAYSGCPVCAPARSTLITGMHMGHTTVRGNTGGIPLKADEVTIADVLKRAGYATGGFGKWGIGDVGTEGVPEKHGFDVFFGYYHQIHAHNYWTDYLWRNSRKVTMAGQPGTAQRYSHYKIFEEAKKFIRDHQNKPFFCYCPWTVPHGKWHIPDDEPALKKFKHKPWPKDAKVLAAMITMLDRHVGELVKLLQELNIDKNTIVFFCSDNGGYRAFDNFFDSNGPLRGQKGYLYEGGLRVPLIVRWPDKIKAGNVTDLPVYFPDVMPTLAELTKATQYLPANVDGLSFAPTLLAKAEKQEKHRYLYWEYHKYDWKKYEYVPDGPMQALRMGKWKAIRNSSAAPFELYDLSTDIGEKKNIADRHRDIVAKMEMYAKEAHTEPVPQVEPEMPAGKKFR